MHPNDRYTVWFVLVVAVGSLALAGQWCHAVEHGSARSNGRKLSAGVGAMHFNHLFGGSDEGFPGAGSAPAAGESVKFSASKQQHVLYPDPALWRKHPTASNWGVRKPLAKPATGSRSRINNRSMTRFSEVVIPAGGLEYRGSDGAIEQPYTPEAGSTNVTGLAELFRSAEQSRGIENFLVKYFVDSDVSASTEDDDDEGDDGVDDEGGAGAGKIGTTALQGRKKKFHLKKKYKKFLIPLLLAYKIKFLALVPAIIGGLILLVKAAGLAGFFFALFTAVVSLKKY